MSADGIVYERCKGCLGSLPCAPMFDCTKPHKHTDRVTRMLLARGWQKGFEAGYDYYPALGRSGFELERPENPYDT